MSGIKREPNEQNRSLPSAVLRTPTNTQTPFIPETSPNFSPPLAPPHDEPPPLEDCEYNVDRNTFGRDTHVVRRLGLDVHDLGLEQLPQLDVVALPGVAAERRLELGGGRDFALRTDARWRGRVGGLVVREAHEGRRVGEDVGEGVVGVGWGVAVGWSGGGGVTSKPLSLRSSTMFMWFPATAMYMIVKPN